MRCLVCGAEMSLEQVIGEDCPPGFERRTFVCSECGDTEQRLKPIKQIEPGAPAAVSMVTAPSVAPLCSEKNGDPAPPGPPSLAPLCPGKDEYSAPPGAPSVAPLCSDNNADPASPGVIKHIFGNLLGLYKAVAHRRSVAHDQVAQPTMRTATPREALTEVQPPGETPSPGLKPVLTCIASPTLVAAEPSSEIYECEALLTRAIELVRTPTRSNPEMQPAPPVTSPSEELVKASRVSTRLSEAQTAFPATEVTSSNLPQAKSKALSLSIGADEADSVAPARSDTSTNLPEQKVEILPLSGTGDVSSLSHGIAEAQSAASIPDAKMPAKDIPRQTPVRSLMPERRPASSIVVEIHYDPGTARYIAKDINTGLSILRIADHQRLRQMCDRMGWQVVSGTG
jgi:hypothetical protein